LRTNIINIAGRQPKRRQNPSQRDPLRSRFRRSRMSPNPPRRRRYHSAISLHRRIKLIKCGHRADSLN
jgi:hypothetical protein